MKDIVADAIRFYYEQDNVAVYSERCRAPLDVAEMVATISAEFADEIECPDTAEPWPAYRVWASFGSYARGQFVAEFDTEILISKLARLFHVRHGFSVENRHEERVAPTLDGLSHTGYIMKQFNFHEALGQGLTARGYTELDLPDMREIIPTLSFPEGVTIFGRQVSVEYALFHDLRGLCPED